MATGKYKEWLTAEGLLKLEGWARDGLTDEQIAFNVGVRRETIYDWIKKYPNISNALKRGKEVVDRQVENALFKRATGYQCTERSAKVVDIPKDELEVKRKQHVNRIKVDYPDLTQRELQDMAVIAIPSTRRVVMQEIDKEIAPDTTAAIFWLKNRKPKEWRDKRETELSGGVNVNNPYADLTADELRKLASEDDG